MRFTTPPVKSKPLDRSTRNAERLITSMRSPNVPKYKLLQLLLFMILFFFVTRTGRTAQPIVIPYTSLRAD
jgi:hypothetical protein